MARIKWRRCQGWCLRAFDELVNLVILITSFGEFSFIILLSVFFFGSFTCKKNKKICCMIVFVLSCSYCRSACSSGLEL